MVRRPSVIRPSSVPNAWPIKAKFYVEPPGVSGTKVCSRHLGHMTKVATSPYMVKTLQKSSSPEPATDFHETWYVASGTPAHNSLFK